MERRGKWHRSLLYRVGHCTKIGSVVAASVQDLVRRAKHHVAVVPADIRVPLRVCPIRTVAIVRMRTAPEGLLGETSLHEIDAGGERNVRGDHGNVVLAGGPSAGLERQSGATVVLVVWAVPALWVYRAPLDSD